MGEDRRRLFATLKIAKSAPVFGGGARPMALYKTSRHQDLYLPTAFVGLEGFFGAWSMAGIGSPEGIDGGKDRLADVCVSGSLTSLSLACAYVYISSLPAAEKWRNSILS